MRSVLQKAQAHSWLAHKFYPQHNSTFYTSKLEAAATGDGHFVSLLCHSIDNPLCQGDDNDAIVPSLSELIQTFHIITRKV